MTVGQFVPAGIWQIFRVLREHICKRAAATAENAIGVLLPMAQAGWVQLSGEKFSQNAKGGQAVLAWIWQEICADKGAEGTVCYGVP